MAWTQPRGWSYKEAPGSDKMNEQIRDNLNYLKTSLPPGVMMSFAGSSAPTQWLLCDGNEVSRTTYSDLFAIIGTTYGSGDGSTTFNLPNRKGKVGVGVDTGQSEFDTLGKTGGEKTHTLSSGEMPVHTHIQNSHNHSQNSHNHSQDSHTHTQNSHNHSQNSHAHQLATEGDSSGSYFSLNGTGSGNRSLSGPTNRCAPATATNNATTATNQSTTATNNATTATNNATTATNQNAGGGAAHNNLSPYITVNYIIKT